MTKRIVLTALVLIGCGPTEVILEITDPLDIAGAATEVRVGSSVTETTTFDIPSAITFPMDITLSRDGGGTVLLYVSANDAAGGLLAQGWANVSFERGQTQSASVALGYPCTESFSDAGECSLENGAGLDGLCIGSVCRESGCGDGFVDAERGEQCDDGSANSDVEPDACRTDCFTPSCGDGVTDSLLGEECDDGDENSDNLPNVCRALCTNPVCGDNQLDTNFGEVCDDNNTLDGDGCRGDCLKIEECGDGLPDEGELCDDANNNPNDACDECRPVEFAAQVELGLGFANTPAAEQPLANPSFVAFDAEDNLYVSLETAHRIVRIDGRDGTISTVIGNGECGDSGDGGPAASAVICNPGQLDFDPLGNLFFIDAGNESSIRRISFSPDEVTTFVASGFVATYTGLGFDGVGRLHAAVEQLFGATNVRVYDPTGVQVGISSALAGGGGSGAIAVAGPQRDRVFVILYPLTQPHTIAEIIAGDYTPFLSGADYTAAGLAYDPIADRLLVGSRTTIESVDLSNFASTTLITNSEAGLVVPRGMDVDRTGRLVIADESVSRVFAFEPGQSDPRVLGGDGTVPPLPLATSTSMGRPTYMVLTPDNRLNVMGLHAVFAIDLTTLELEQLLPSPGFAPDYLGGLAIDGDTLYLTDVAISLGFPPSSTAIRVDANTATGTWSTTPVGFGWAACPLANGADGKVYEGINLGAAGHRVRELAQPSSSTTVTNLQCFAVDSAGSVWFSDLAGALYRRLDPFGTPVDEAVSRSACAGIPQTIAMAPGPDTSDDEWMYFAWNGRILRASVSDLEVQEFVGTCAGVGLPFSGEGGPAIAVTGLDPSGVAVGADGTVYFSHATETGAGYVRAVDPVSGIVRVVAGPANPQGVGPVAQSRFSSPSALAFADGPENLLVVDDAVQRLLLANDTELRSVVGNPTPGAPGAVPEVYYSRLLKGPQDMVWVPGMNSAFIAERDGHTLRKVDIDDPADLTGWGVSDYIGLLDDAGYAEGDSATARFDSPSGLSYSAAQDRIYIADAGNHVIRAVELSNGTTSLVAGKPPLNGFPRPGISPDVVQPLDARLNYPTGVLYDALAGAAGGLYIADSSNNRVWHLDFDTGFMSVVLRDWDAMTAPKNLAADAYGNLYITTPASVLRLAPDANGIADGSTTAVIYGESPRNTFPESVTQCLGDIVPDPVDPSVLHMTELCKGWVIELRAQQL